MSYKNNFQKLNHQNQSIQIQNSKKMAINETKGNWIFWAEDAEAGKKAPTAVQLLAEGQQQLNTMSELLEQLSSDTEATQGKLQTLIGSCSETIRHERLTEDRLAVGQIISPILARKIRPGPSSVFMVENIRCCKMVVGLTPTAIRVTNLAMKHYRDWTGLGGCRIGAMVEVYDTHEPHTINRAMVAEGGLDRITNMNATHPTRGHIEKYYY